jgi:adenine-specific DNA methylase
MLTCIGNKRKLVSNIASIVEKVRESISKEKLNIVDGFAGSSVVSRQLCYLADNLYSNDMELYASLMYGNSELLEMRNCLEIRKWHSGRSRKHQLAVLKTVCTFAMSVDIS